MAGGKRKFSPTGDLGVHAVAALVYERLGWILRPQPEADLGIDAEIEIVEHGESQKQLLKVQIKSGPSWFSEASKDGYMFRGSDDHFQYWLDFCLPVIVVLYHRQKREAFWQLVDYDNAQQTGSNWKLLIPAKQKLNRASKAALRKIAAEHARKRAEFTDIGERVNASSLAGKSDLPDFIATALRAAQHIVYIVTPHLSSDVLWLLRTVADSVPIRLIAGNPPPLGNRQSFAQAASHRNLDVRLMNPNSATHMKSIVIDDDLCLFFSGNFTQPSLASNYEACFAISDPRAVSATMKSYWELWGSSVPAARYFEVFPSDLESKGTRPPIVPKPPRAKRTPFKK
jgi:phosphatidylserine/phosphatidylglycerophosphate/cardiolipin synthase-like enzyme